MKNPPGIHFCSAQKRDDGGGKVGEEGEPPGFSEFLSSNQEPEGGGGGGIYTTQTWGNIDPWEANFFSYPAVVVV